MNGLFIPGITAEMFRSGCLESIEDLMAEGELIDVDIRYEPKKGSWEHCEDEDGMYDVCSNCGADVDISHYGRSYNYCPHCGAKMEVAK